MVGTVLLGKYKVMRPLDTGGMSKIFVAKQTDSAREVVVKVLKPEYAAQPKAREHFRREIHILSRFQHPNAVMYFDSDPHNATGPVLVMEYMRGLDLGMLLAREGKFAPDRVGRLLVQICDVLMAAHEAGIVHRDIKPGNLFVVYPGTPQETVKLMDFGLAKMSSLFYIAPEDVKAFNDTPTAAGTPEYISPEQLRGHEGDRRSDIYSLGIVLFELLTGKRPFDRPSLDEILLAHAEDDPPTFAEMGLEETVSPLIERVVQRCLSKVPEQRPQTAGELIYAYEKALGRKLTHGRNFVPTSPNAQGTSTREMPVVSERVAAALNKARTVLRGEPANATPATGTPMTQNRQATPTNLNAPPPGEDEKGVIRKGDSNSIKQSLEANMPEAMALLKIKGFIVDVGGEIVESLPGMIRFQLGAKQKSGGVMGWLLGSNKQQSSFPATEVELHMARRDPFQASKLTITIVMRPVNNRLPTAEWRAACDVVTREFQAYIGGR